MTTTRTLPDTLPAEILPDGRFPVGTRTGAKIHGGSAGSSVTACGHWMKFNGERSRRYEPVNCERCISVLADRCEIPAEVADDTPADDDTVTAEVAAAEIARRKANKEAKRTGGARTEPTSAAAFELSNTELAEIVAEAGR